MKQLIGSVTAALLAAPGVDVRWAIEGPSLRCHVQIQCAEGLCGFCWSWHVAEAERMQGDVESARMLRQLHDLLKGFG